MAEKPVTTETPLESDVAAALPGDAAMQHTPDCGAAAEEKCTLHKEQNADSSYVLHALKTDALDSLTEQSIHHDVLKTDDLDSLVIQDIHQDTVRTNALDSLGVRNTHQDTIPHYCSEQLKTDILTFSATIYDDSDIIIDHRSEVLPPPEEVQMDEVRIEETLEPQAFAQYFANSEPEKPHQAESTTVVRMLMDEVLDTNVTLEKIQDQAVEEEEEDSGERSSNEELSPLQKQVTIETSEDGEDKSTDNEEDESEEEDDDEEEEESPSTHLVEIVLPGQEHETVVKTASVPVVAEDVSQPDSKPRRSRMERFITRFFLGLAYNVQLRSRPVETSMHVLMSPTEEANRVSQPVDSAVQQEASSTQGSRPHRKRFMDRFRSKRSQTIPRMRENATRATITDEATAESATTPEAEPDSKSFFTSSRFRLLNITKRSHSMSPSAAAAASTAVSDPSKRNSFNWFELLDGGLYPPRQSNDS